MKLLPMSFTGFDPKEHDDAELKKLLDLKKDKAKKSFNLNNLSTYTDLTTDIYLIKMELKKRRQEHIALKIYELLYKASMLAHAILP